MDGVMQPDELEIPLNTLEGQRLLGARDVIAEEAFADAENSAKYFPNSLILPYCNRIRERRTICPA
jgi:hypothetical protein